MAAADPSGEITHALSEREKAFLRGTAAPALELVTSVDLMKHFAEVWWNLCLWEKQRADALDTKATGVLGLASVASAIVAVGGTSLAAGGLPHPPLWRLVGAVLFLVSALLAIVALYVRDHGGFSDVQLYKALSAGNAADQLPADPNNPALIAYLQQLTMQRWLVYISFKETSNDRASWVFRAQVVAGFAVVAVAVAVWQLH